MKPAPFDKVALTRHRLKQAQDTLHDAHVLHEQGGTPTSIVNRSYYAIFYAVMALIGTLSVNQDFSKHKGVIAIFDREFIKKKIFPREFSKILHEAFEARQEGDYREASKIDRAKANAILKSADEFIAIVAQKLQ